MKNEVTNKLYEWMNNVSTNGRTNEKRSYKQMFGSNNKWKNKQMSEQMNG